MRPAEAKRVKAGLADGGIQVVVGTHALAAKGVRFRDLGLAFGAITFVLFNYGLGLNLPAGSWIR